MPASLSPLSRKPGFSIIVLKAKKFKPAEKSPITDILTISNQLSLRYSLQIKSPIKPPSQTYNPKELVLF